MSDLRSRIMQCSSKPIQKEQADLGTVYIRRLTLGELDQMQNEVKAAAADPKAPALPLTARLLSRFLGDESGNPLFDATKEEDKQALLNFPVSIASDLLRMGNAVNKLEEDEVPAKNA